MSDPEIHHEQLRKITCSIVKAHVSNNPVPLADLPGLIETVYSTLT